MTERKSLSIWAACLAAAALIGVALSFHRFGDRLIASDDGAAQITIGEARAIGARWRASREEVLGREYARALLDAGLYDELFAEIEQRGLFAGDSDAASLFRAEANLRQGRYEEAITAAAGGEENPYMAFARARGRYALTSNAAAVAGDLSRALRGPKDLSAEAWLFRARLALDANDFANAEAATRRATEAGVLQSRADQILIEKAIREGDLRQASALLKARAKRMRAAVDPGDYRLAAMIKLRDGDPKAAARLVDLARRGLAVDQGTRLLAALAKWRTGDNAQAWSLVSAHLAASPDDWIALDLGAALARDMRRDDVGKALLSRLADERPALALIRRLRFQPAALDAAFGDLLALNGAQVTQGAAAALLGAGVEIEGLEEARASEISLINLATASSAHDPRAMRRAAHSIAENGASPLALAMAGIAFEEAGDDVRADALFVKASADAPGFLAPVKLRAARMQRDGDFASATALLRLFLATNRDDEGARLLLAATAAAGGEAADAASTYASIDPALIFADEQLAAGYGDAAKKAGGKALATMRRAAMANAPSVRILGLALAAAGEDEAAAAAIRKALIAEPADRDLDGPYLEAMIRLGRESEARSLLAEIGRQRGGMATDSDPNRRNIAESMVEILQ